MWKAAVVWIVALLLLIWLAYFVVTGSLKVPLMRNGFRMDRWTLALSHCVDRLDAKALTGDASGRSTVCVKGNPSIYKEYRDELEKDSFNDLS